MMLCKSVLRALAASAWALALLPASAHATGLLTIVDGEASVVDGAQVVIATEGLKVTDQAIVRTGAKAALVRVEWPDGTVADLGPDTQAMLRPTGPGSRAARPALYLLRGWAKLSSLDKAPNAGLVTPLIELAPFKGVVVALASSGETWLFAESGSVALVERDIGASSATSLRPGETYVRAGSGKGSVASRPTPAQMQRVPRGFRDSLPMRFAGLKDRKVDARPAPAPGYAELREWLIAEPGLRKGFVKRFAARTRDPAFRAGLVQNLRSHPEWEPLLFPERFVKPRPATAPTR